MHNCDLQTIQLIELIKCARRRLSNGWVFKTAYLCALCFCPELTLSRAVGLGVWFLSWFCFVCVPCRAMLESTHTKQNQDPVRKRTGLLSPFPASYIAILNPINQGFHSHFVWFEVFKSATICLASGINWISKTTESSVETADCNITIALETTCQKLGGLGVADMFVLNITAAFHGHSVTCGVTKSVIINSLDKEEEAVH